MLLHSNTDSAQSKAEKIEYLMSMKSVDFLRTYGVHLAKEINHCVKLCAKDLFPCAVVQVVIYKRGDTIVVSLGVGDIAIHTTYRPVLHYHLSRFDELWVKAYFLGYVCPLVREKEIIPTVWDVMIL